MSNKIKAFLILIIMTGGGACDPCRCPEVLQYFSVQGIEELVQRTNTGEILSKSDSILFNDLGQFQIFYEIEYVAASSGWQWENPFISSAYACSCTYDGFGGSKDDRLINLSIITLNDFNMSYNAGDTINDLFELSFPVMQTDLNSYLDAAPHHIDYEYLALKLTEAPSLNPELHLKLVMVLSNGRTYERESEQITIIQ